MPKKSPQNTNFPFGYRQEIVGISDCALVYRQSHAKKLSRCASVNAWCNFVTDRWDHIDGQAVAGMTPKNENNMYLTLIGISPRNSVMNSGNASTASCAFSLIWIFRAETLTAKRHSESSYPEHYWNNPTFGNIFICLCMRSYTYIYTELQHTRSVAPYTKCW